MLIYNVFNEFKEKVGNLYVEKNLLIEEENNELKQVIGKILKKGITYLSGVDNDIKNRYINDSFITINTVNKKTFWVLRQELIKLGYIVSEVLVKEV